MTVSSSTSSFLFLLLASAEERSRSSSSGMMAPPGFCSAAAALALLSSVITCSCSVLTTGQLASMPARRRGLEPRSHDRPQLVHLCFCLSSWHCL